MADTVAAIVDAPDWSQRVRLIRQIPEAHGIAAHRQIYADLARQLYVPALTPDFAYVHWREEYELDSVSEAYRAAYSATDGYTRVSVADLARAVQSEPRTTLVWRLLVGFTWVEFAAATEAVAVEAAGGFTPASADRLRRLERGQGKPVTPGEARVIAEVTAQAVAGTLWPPVPDGRRTKQHRPDLAQGWETVRRFATDGVPLEVLLHQRLYEGAFRQLLDSTSSMRGDSLEDALADELDLYQIPYLRTGAHDQAEIRSRFNITIQPAPDFVFHDATDTLRAMLEAKLTNDGGTARDKAGRFGSLRQECQRLGGIPLFGLVDGLGWARAADALGPVIRDCDGRVFTRATLADMLALEPFPGLVQAAA
ncbi:MAG: hypothetical protein ACRDT2_11105 [Natronosporangium sp.]